MVLGLASVVVYGISDMLMAAATFNSLSALLATVMIAVIGLDYCLRQPVALIQKIMMLLVLVLLLLTTSVRGAPHNNPLVYWFFENWGLEGLIGLYGFLGIVIAIAYILYIKANGQKKKLEWSEVGVKQVLFSLLLPMTAISALTAVIGPVWDSSGWGDSIFYDVIAHHIAIGDLPSGHGYYMPIFQYGHALLYWAFGHFFYVPVLVNVSLAPLTVLFASLAAWHLFRSPLAMLLMAVLTTFNDLLRHSPELMQIENWYVPIATFILYAVIRYWRIPNRRQVMVLALVLAFAFNLRTQGVFFYGFVLLAPFFLWKLSWRVRRQHVVLLWSVFFLLMLPWTVRNVVVDDRFSPVGNQGPAHLVYSNYQEVFHGIRRDLGAEKIVADWEQRYPDKSERENAMREHFWHKILNETDYFVSAFPWRVMAFYGVLPPGVWDSGGVRPTNWLQEGPAWLAQKLPILALLAASFFGLIFFQGRITVFLVGAIMGNLALVFLVGSSEPRISYPVLPLHYAMALLPLFRVNIFQTVDSEVTDQNSLSRLPRVAVLASLVGLGLVSSHFFLGQRHLQRALPEPMVTLGSILPAMEKPQALYSKPRLIGEHVSFECMLTHYSFPVKWYLHPLPPFPEFATDPKREQYYRCLRPAANGKFSWVDSRYVGVSWQNAHINQMLREGDVVQLEGVIAGDSVIGEHLTYWVQVERAAYIRAGRFSLFSIQ